MLWINFLFFILSLQAAELPRFLTKHSSETLRFISMDGRYAYVQKKPGVLGLVSSFRSIDFLTDANANNFLVRGSRFKNRLTIESVPNAHDELSLVKNHKIFVMDYGNSITREIGIGRGAKLHLQDEWITYYNIVDKVIHVENLLTQKKFSIKVSAKANPFFIPEVEMVSQSSILYTDINENGYAALVGYNLATLKSNITYKSSQTATRLELCQSENYLGMGEFPYDGVNRGSKIQYIKLTEQVNLAGFTTLYSSVEQDVGNMICLPNNIYFIKTMNQDKVLNYKVTEAVKLEIATQNIEARSSLKHVTQLLEMDGRVLIPLRGQFLVLEGKNNLSEDILKSVPTKEELQIDL
jgi:hypothetical protein